MEKIKLVDYWFPFFYTKNCIHFTEKDWWIRHCIPKHLLHLEVDVPSLYLTFYYVKKHRNKIEQTNQWWRKNIHIYPCLSFLCALQRYAHSPLTCWNDRLPCWCRMYFFLAEINTKNINTGIIFAWIELEVDFTIITFSMANYTCEKYSNIK